MDLPVPAFRDVIDVPLVVRRIHKSRSEVKISWYGKDFAIMQFSFSVPWLGSCWFRWGRNLALQRMWRWSFLILVDRYVVFTLLELVCFSSLSEVTCEALASIAWKLRFLTLFPVLPDLLNYLISLLLNWL